MIPLVISEQVDKDIKYLIQMAQANPVNMIGLIERLQTIDGRAKHMAQMSAQTIAIPFAFLVTFSIETGHAIGSCRHMSMSVQKEGRIPHPTALWIIATKFGFRHNLEHCTVWKEQLQGHDVAINIVQTLNES